MQCGITCYPNISLFHSPGGVPGKCVDHSFDIFLWILLCEGFLLCSALFLSWLDVGKPLQRGEAKSCRSKNEQEM